MLLVLAVMLFGCAHTKPDAKAADAYTHRSGLFSFPTSLASMVREEVKSYDTDGNDVGVTYRDPSSRLVITIYAYPAPKLGDGSTSSLSDHFAAEDATILKASDGTAQIDWPRGLPIWSDEGVPGILQAYDFNGNRDTTSILQLYDYGLWRLKFRSTYPNSSAAHAEELIDEVHKAFKWVRSRRLQAAPSAS